MKRSAVLLGIGFFIAMLITGCGNQASLSVSEIVDFDQAVDLSPYIIEEPEPEEQAPVEQKTNLNYVDTDYIMKLKEGAGEISAARSTYQQFPSEWDFVLVDSRPANVFNEGHINGAINIPDVQFESLKDLLPKEKDKLIIFYCGGMHCELSGNSAEKASKLGYTNIKVYQEGIPAWKQAGNYLTVTTDYVKDNILEANITNENQTPVVILDVRPYTLYFESHIPGALFADDTMFAQKFNRVVPQDKNTEIIAYCGGFNCHKSHNVAGHLINSGYNNVKVYSGGLPEWVAQGLPTFGTSSGDSEFNVSEGKVNRGLTPEQFVEKLTTVSNVFVLDVRGAGEIANGMISGATNIPDGDIHADASKITDKLPADKNATILIHCASGARAAGVVNKIADLGYPNTFYLNHAIQISADGSYSFP